MMKKDISGISFQKMKPSDKVGIFTTARESDIREALGVDKLSMDWLSHASLEDIKTYLTINNIKPSTRLKILTIDEQRTLFVSHKDSDLKILLGRKNLPKKWIEGASIYDIKTYLETNDAYGKGARRLQTKESGLSGFYDTLSKKPIYKSASAETKSFMLGVDMVDHSRLDDPKTTPETIKTYLEAHDAYGKGARRLQTKESGLSGFYSALKEKPIYKSASAETKSFMLGVDMVDHSRLDDPKTTPETIKIYLEAHDAYGKGARRLSAKESGLNGFYGALAKSPLYSNASPEQRSLMLGVDMVDHSRLDDPKTTPETIKIYLEAHDAYGKGATRLSTKESGLSGFYSALKEKPIYKSASAETKSFMLGVDMVGHSRLDDPKTTPETIKIYLEAHDAYGKGATRLSTKESGFKGFYDALSKKPIYNSASAEERSFMIGMIPDHQFECGEGGSVCVFDSYPEKVLGVLLWRLGIIDHRTEGENLHVRTNGSARHSIDFKIGDTFLEYHPYVPRKGSEHRGGSFEGEANYKRKHITNPRYVGSHDLIVIDGKNPYRSEKDEKWKVRQNLCKKFYETIRQTPALMSRIPLDQRYHIIDYHNFKKFYHTIEADIHQYDNQRR